MGEFFKEYKVRTFWLLVGLIGSFFIAKVISNFESVLQENIVLAYFIPLIVYVSDAVGTQMESIIIRSLSQEKHFEIKTFFKKQLLLTSLIAITLALVTGVLVYVIFGDYYLSLTISLGLLFSVLSALVTGVMIPYYFWKSHQDPAEASGPIATIIQDFLSIFIFFLVATIIL